MNAIENVYSRHPVISTFLWRKWQSISNDVRQNLRSSTIFTITASRAILTAYDIKQYNYNTSALNNTTVETNAKSQSCHYQDNWLWSPGEGFHLDWEWDWDQLEFGSWITAAQCLWILFLILRWIYK